VSATTSTPGAALRARGLAGFRAVFGREFRAAFDAPIAYVAIGATLVATTSWFLNEFFLTGKLDLSPYFELLPWALAMLAPALGMRLWAEDHRTRTIELWRTLPLSASQVVLGKFTAALAVLALFLAGSLPLFGLLEWLGDPDRGAIAAGYLGALFLGAEFLAIAAFVSSRTADQITAFLVAALAAVVLTGLGDPRVVAVLDGLAPAAGFGTFLAEVVSPATWYAEFVRGYVPFAGVLHMAGVTAAFLVLNARSAVEERA
jgi:ABC-2 type transport system permease protein